MLCVSGCATERSGHGTALATSVTVTSTTPRQPTTAAVAAPTPTPSPTPTPVPVNECAGNTHVQLVLVNISDQTAWMCSAQTTVYTTPVTTGATADGYDDTPTGTWHVESRQTNQTLRLLSGATYHVNYWLPFQGNLYGFHDAAWQTMPFGSQDYHTLGSHGCVHLPMAAMAWLFSWASVGTTVTVRA
jgi:lipoprotein-anchoring transpeptidase ErfK/SrfK